MDSKLKYFGVIATLIAVLALGVAISKAGKEITVKEVLVPQLSGTTNVDTLEAENLFATASSTLAATTTIKSSYDGTVAGGRFSVTATGTAVAIYTNRFGPEVCFNNSGSLNAKANNFAPSLQVSIGTSTSATSHLTNLLSSTTVATTTSGSLLFSLSTVGQKFVLQGGESIVATFADITNTEASSTYFSRWDFDFGIDCHQLYQ